MDNDRKKTFRRIPRQLLAGYWTAGFTVYWVFPPHFFLFFFVVVYLFIIGFFFALYPVPYG